MCRLCLPRRAFLAAPALLPFAPASDAPIEPRLRLANPPPGSLNVALTLDACPGAFDTRIANTLIEHSVPATIFVTAMWMQRNPAGLALLLAHRDLFVIENHGALHIPPVLDGGSIYGIKCAGDLDAIRREVSDGATAIVNATGGMPRWYRGATGFYSPSALPTIRKLGFGIAGYFLNGDHGASLPAGTVARRITGATNGDVIVAHINQPGRPSGAGVAAGVLDLLSRGARFCHLDQPDPSA
jgi:peptidoglycan/xylan/chitin deacetylase (PgdA/CDA1 family)